MPLDPIDGHQDRLDDKQEDPAYEKRSMHMYQNIRQLGEDHPGNKITLSESDDNRNEDQQHHSEEEHIITSEPPWRDRRCRYGHWDLNSQIEK